MNKIIKNFTPALVVALLSATAIFSISQASAFERGGYKGVGSFNRIDTNQDGQLSLDELTIPALSKAEKKLNKKDSDEDGLISFEEFQQTRNGTLSDLSDIANDIVQCVTDVKAESGDDNITVPSADQFMSPEDKFATTDTSGDGFISLEELQTKVTTNVAMTFLIKDQDADGFVNEDEYNAAKEKYRATKAVIRQCIDELSSDDIV
jgi:Ca2+-binding EF-hand superfamily protein